MILVQCVLVGNNMFVIADNSQKIDMKINMWWNIKLNMKYKCDESISKYSADTVRRLYRSESVVF